VQGIPIWFPRASPPASRWGHGRRPLPERQCTAPRGRRRLKSAVGARRRSPPNPPARVGTRPSPRRQASWRRGASVPRLPVAGGLGIRLGGETLLGDGAAIRLAGRGVVDPAAAAAVALDRIAGRAV